MVSVDDDEPAGRPRSVITDQNIAKIRDMRKKRPELGKDGWPLNQDKAPAHTALSAKHLSHQQNITALWYPPYSPDLTSCDFFFKFLTVKSCLRGTHFTSVEKVQAKMESPEGPSITLIPKLLTAIASPNAEGCEC
ncbi:hypothetical protein TNCV_377001 [Trichonephila clavipes]|nr:hypothetical protein TNCV_377001 [Trichonephila clavipes]